MTDWKFEKVDNDFPQIKVGSYKMRIENAEEQVSSKGNDMIKLTLTVSGEMSKLFDYIVYMPENRDITNAKLTKLFNSFGIDNDLNCQNWKGKIGAGVVKIDENGFSKINYYIPKNKQNDLGSWVEPTRSTFTPVDVDKEPLPF
jgi:hypothetical protein